MKHYLYNKKSLLLLFLSLSLVACSSGPIVDLKGKDEAKYKEDLAECEKLADTANGAAKSGLMGAGVGALAGGLLAIVGGGNPTDAAQTAGVGAVLGGGVGAAKGTGEKTKVLNRCLAGRGYQVLND